MKKFLTTLPFLIAIGCAIAYNIIGCRVLPDGTLDEPFFLVPIECFFFFVGIILLVVRFILFLKTKLC